MNTDLYIIEYQLHGEPKSVIIRSRAMRNADAWHWASCDAGIAPIPKPGRPLLKLVSKPRAEQSQSFSQSLLLFFLLVLVITQIPTLLLLGILNRSPRSPLMPAPPCFNHALR